jgi:hypothetical protein
MDTPTSPIKLLSWNCQWLARPTAVRTLRALIRKPSHELIYIFFLKPKHVLKRLYPKSIGFLFVGTPTSTKGGLLLAWRPGVGFRNFFV